MLKEGYEPFEIPIFYGNPIMRIRDNDEVTHEYWIVKNSEGKVKGYEKVNDTLLTITNVETVEDWISMLVDKYMTSSSPFVGYFSTTDDGKWVPSTREEYVRYWRNKIIENYKKGDYNS